MAVPFHPHRYFSIVGPSRERERSRGALYDYRGATPRVRERKGGIFSPSPLRLRKVAIDLVANCEAGQCLPRASGT